MGATNFIGTNLPGFDHVNVKNDADNDGLLLEYAAENDFTIQRIWIDHAKAEQLARDILDTLTAE